MRLFQEAGLPDGVINLVYGSGATIGDAALGSPHLAGIHFTGSTPVFNGMWRTVASNMERFRNYPRIVGETGGKDFIVAHPSADVDALATAIVRGSFEYQGQKCSAVVARLRAVEPLAARCASACRSRSRRSRWATSPTSATSWAPSSTARRSARRPTRSRRRRRARRADIVVGGGYDDSRGYFVEPTVIETRDPDFRTMRDELFGPVVTTYVYDENKWDDTLELVDKTAPYGLTGAVFSEDRAAAAHAQQKLRYAAGNFYVNDKPTGAVVGQQPFGGARASGTNDKAGSMWNLIRWVSPRSIKETFMPPTSYRYPFMDGGTDDAGT